MWSWTLATWANVERYTLVLQSNIWPAGSQALFFLVRSRPLGRMPWLAVPPCASALLSCKRRQEHGSPKSQYISTHTSPSLGYAQPDTPESARTQHSRTQTSRPRAGCSHTQHWATHGRPRQSQLRRSTAACRHRVTHTHTSPHHYRPHTARRARVSPDAARPHADIQATRGMFPHAALGHARPATPKLASTQHGRV